MGENAVLCRRPGERGAALLDRLGGAAFTDPLLHDIAGDPGAPGLGGPRPPGDRQ